MLPIHTRFLFFFLSLNAKTNLVLKILSSLGLSFSISDILVGLVLVCTFSIKFEFDGKNRNDEESLNNCNMENYDYYWIKGERHLLMQRKKIRWGEKNGKRLCNFRERTDKRPVRAETSHAFRLFQARVIWVSEPVTNISVFFQEIAQLSFLCWEKRGDRKKEFEGDRSWKPFCTNETIERLRV